MTSGRNAMTAIGQSAINGPSAGAAAPIAMNARPKSQPVPDVAATRTRLAIPVVIFMFCIVFPIGANVGSLAVTSLRLYLMIMVIPLSISLLAGRYGKIMAIDVLFFLHISLATVALAVNNPTQVLQQIGSVGAEFFGGYLIGRAYIRKPSDFVALAKLLITLVLLSFPFALFETMTGRPLILELIRKIPGATTVAFNIQAGRLGLEKVQMTFAHPIHYGLFCAVAFPLGFVGLKGNLSTPIRYLTSTITGLCGFLALSSGALLAVLLQICLISWAWIFNRVQRRWLLLLGMFAFLYVVIDILSNRTPIEVFMSYATFSAHTAYWRSIIFEWGMKNVWANPWLGIGLNEWVRPYYMYSGSMDNFWLVMAVRYGIPSFLCLAIGYAIALWKIGRRDFSANTNLGNLRRAWMFSFCGLTFTLTTVHVWTNIYSFVFFMFAAGLWMITAKSDPDDVNRDGLPESGGDVVPLVSARQSTYTRFPQKPARRPLD
ncbi:MAG: O-antigen ligase family protein [Candidatus Saccharibacteria bacterium]|nr:O-antigen ligase family protein [Pseudorhodobacter sp.]